MTRPRVEILYFDGCPNHEPARDLVEQVAAELGLQAQIELVEVPDADTATRLRFLGSPSVRVDGRDVEPGADERVKAMLELAESLLADNTEHVAACCRIEEPNG